MKKLLIVLAVIFLILAVSCGVFFVTFDANRYKGLITANFEKALGKPVTIGSIALTWQGGAALDISKLAAPGIALESAGARVQLLPLLQKKIRITSVVLDRPFIDTGKLFKKTSPANPASGASAKNISNSPAIVFSVDSIAVRGGKVLHEDLEIKNFDLNVKNFSLTKPFSFTAAASVFSEKQNIQASGTVRLPAGLQTSPEISNLLLETDLAFLDIQKLAKAFPDFAAAGIRQDLRGNLKIQVNELNLDPKSLDSAKGKATLENGKIALTSIDFPIEKISAEAIVGGGEVRVNRLTAEAAGGIFEFSGRAYGLRTQPMLELKGAIKELPLGQLVKNINPNAPQLAGHVTLLLEGQARGLAWESISKSLNGRARILIRDGVILNFNILREIFEKVSVIPGAAEALQARFPQAYAMRLQDRSTILRPVDMSANIADGTFHFDPLQIETEFVLLNGAGNIGLDRRIGARANLIVNQEISQAFVRSLNSFGLLCNNRGEMVIPVDIFGMIPQIRVVPDKNYITSKLLSGAAQEIVGQLVSDPGEGFDKIQNLFKKNIKGLNI